MNYQLSKREKQLLYILLILVIVLAGWFVLLKPSLSERNHLTVELNEKDTKLNGLKNTYNDYKNAPQKAVDETTAFVAYKEQFYPSMNNEDIDNMLTRMCLLHQLKPYNLNIGEVSGANVISFADALKDEETATAEDQEDVLVNKVEVSISVAGSILDAFTLADEIKDSTSIRLMDYTYIKGDTIENSTMVLIFEIYMLNE